MSWFKKILPGFNSASKDYKSLDMSQIYAGLYRCDFFKPYSKNLQSVFAKNIASLMPHGTLKYLTYKNIIEKACVKFLKDIGCEEKFISTHVQNLAKKILDSMYEDTSNVTPDSDHFFKLSFKVIKTPDQIEGDSDDAEAERAQLQTTLDELTAEKIKFLQNHVPEMFAGQKISTSVETSPTELANS